MNLNMNWVLAGRDQFIKSLFPLGGLALSFVVCGIMLLFFGIDPVGTYVSIFSRAFGRLNGLSETIGGAIPMIIIAVGIIFVKRVGVFNLGAEGQMILGALGAQVVAVRVGSLPVPAALLLTLAGGAALGMFWAVVPALLRVRLRVNEIVVCIMFNQIAVYLIGFLLRKPLKDPHDFNSQAVVIPPSARMPQFVPDTKIHLGLVIAIVLIVVIAWVLNKTTFGYRVGVVGASLRTAAYAGIPVSATLLGAFLIGGTISGIAGAGEVMAVSHRMQATISQNNGFVGLTVAMIAKGNPAMLAITAVLYSALQVGGFIIQITRRVPMELADIIQAMTVLFVLSADFLYKKYRSTRELRRMYPGAIK